jgi:hypothetical protein
MAGEILPLAFQVRERNQNTPTPCSCLTTPGHEMFPEFFLTLDIPLTVADVHTLMG